MVPDHLLGQAPDYSTTFEGGDGKPSVVEVNSDPTLMNRWCVRQCERNSTGSDPDPRYDTFRFNLPPTRDLVTSKPGWEDALTQFYLEAKK